jgi:hypothetical protein
MRLRRANSAEPALLCRRPGEPRALSAAEKGSHGESRRERHSLAPDGSVCENSSSGNPVGRNAGESSPRGANQRSPALQRWDKCGNDSSPGGTTQFSRPLEGWKGSVSALRAGILRGAKQKIPLQGRVHRETQGFVVFILQRDKTKCLQNPAGRNLPWMEHFGHAVDRARLGLESDLDEVALAALGWIA